MKKKSDQYLNVRKSYGGWKLMEYRKLLAGDIYWCIFQKIWVFYNFLMFKD